MYLKKIYSPLVCLLLAAMVFTGCEDRLDYSGIIVGPGEAAISAEVTFQPMQPSLNGARGEEGTIISNINDINVIIYTPGEGDSTEPQFYSAYFFTGKELVPAGENTSVPDDYGDADKKAETTTKKYALKLPGSMSFGKYYFYAVANIGHKLADNEVSTPSKLQDIRIEWDNANVASNNKMFGYFNVGDGGNSQPNEEGVYAAPLITINQSQMRIHAWMRRLASKLTICFDGSQLKENVFIYIHKATIKQIAPSAYLGKNSNCGTAAKDTTLYLTGQSIYYSNSGGPSNEDKFQNESDYHEWLTVMRGSNLLGAVDKDKSHPENALSLFFYENMQGDFENNPNKQWYNKTQNRDSVGTNIVGPGQPDYKDNVPCGTYVEVEGYYVNRNPESQSYGPITYRFMLGQNTTYNYDVIRNQHYKLDMAFVGLGNQVDWHIKYEEEEPGQFPPDYFYMPYLYNRSVEFPIRLTGNPKRVWVQIVENNWAPYDSTTTDSVPKAIIGTGTTAFKWNKDVYSDSQYYYGLKPGQNFGIYANEATIRGYFENSNNLSIPKELLDKAVYTDKQRKVTCIWAGFLALKAPTGVSSMDNMPTEIFNRPGTDFYSKEITYEGIRKYFLGKYIGDDVHAGTSENNVAQNIAYFDMPTDDNEKVVSGINGYRVSQAKKVNGNTSRTLYIPVFNRPKAIGYISGFTGNNPYEMFPRKATLRIVSEFDTPNGTVTKVNEVPIYQSERIVNPKAVWCKWDDPVNFNVKLSKQNSRTYKDGNMDFQPIHSRGPWSITTEGDFFSVSKSGGSTGSLIDFNIEFNGNLGASTDVKCGRVIVHYHGGTAEHIIFVRQGYNQPIQLVSAGAYWSSYCLSKFTKTDGTTAEITDNPSDIGNFFRLIANVKDADKKDYRKGILAKNNTKYGVLVSIGDDTLSMTSGKGTKWTDIPGGRWNKGDDSYSWPDFTATVNGQKRSYSLPTYNDFNAIKNNCDFGYGILYADATETALNYRKAFGHDSYTSDEAHGMRGVIAYNAKTAALKNNQIFFPVGAYGVGRRTLQNTNSTTRGYLRYGALAVELTQSNNKNNQYRPICYNLPASPGALYWIKSPNGEYIGWDMNYFDMSFNGQDYAATYYWDNSSSSTKPETGNQYGSDAILIKPVLIK